MHLAALWHYMTGSWKRCSARPANDSCVYPIQSVRHSQKVSSWNSIIISLFILFAMLCWTEGDCDQEVKTSMTRKNIFLQKSTVTNDTWRNDPELYLKWIISAFLSKRNYTACQSLKCVQNTANILILFKEAHGLTCLINPHRFFIWDCCWHSQVIWHNQHWANRAPKTGSTPKKTHMFQLTNGS